MYFLKSSLCSLDWNNSSGQKQDKTSNEYEGIIEDFKTFVKKKGL